MARDNPPSSKYRTIPAHGKYPGLTGLALGGTKELIVMGTGNEAEQALATAKERRE